MVRTTAFAAFIIAPILALPQSTPPTGQPYSCSNYTLNFDDLPLTNGHSVDLPKNGWDYKKLSFASSNYWGYVSNGVQEVYATDANDEYIKVNSIAKSGKNALITANWYDGADKTAFGVLFDAASSTQVCHRNYFDLKTLWIRGHTGAPFTWEIRCRRHVGLKDVKLRVNIPAASTLKKTNGYKKVTLTKDFTRIWRCNQGDIRGHEGGGELILLDDIAVQMCDVNSC